MSHPVLPVVFALPSAGELATPVAILIGLLCIGWLVRNRAARNDDDASVFDSEQTIDVPSSSRRPTEREMQLIEEVKTLRAELEALRERQRGPGPSLAQGPDLSRGPDLSSGPSMRT